MQLVFVLLLFETFVMALLAICLSLWLLVADNRSINESGIYLLICRTVDAVGLTTQCGWQTRAVPPQADAGWWGAECDQPCVHAQGPWRWWWRGWWRGTTGSKSYLHWQCCEFTLTESLCVCTGMFLWFMFFNLKSCNFKAVLGAIFSPPVKKFSSSAKVKAKFCILLTANAGQYPWCMCMCDD